MSANKKNDPKIDLEDLLNNWEGHLRNHFELDSFEKEVGNIKWEYEDLDKVFRMKSDFDYFKMSHSIIIEIEKSTKQIDGFITSKIGEVLNSELVFNREEMKKWLIQTKINNFVRLLKVY